MVFNTSSVVPYDVAEQAVMFFILRFYWPYWPILKVAITFLCAILFTRGLPPMLRLIIVNHESSVDTILFRWRDFNYGYYTCLVLYSIKLKFKSAVVLTETWNGLFRHNPFHCPTSRTFRDERLG